MPHQCTNCQRTFEDGSKQMLTGCPDCGGNKFQFLPPGSVDEPIQERTSPDDGMFGLPGTRDVGSNRSPGSASTSESDIIEAPDEPSEPEADVEDRAQATARRSIVSDDELPATEGSRDERPVAQPEAEPDRPDLAELRAELNEQFESIKILQPGKYELNLMELYDRQEYIIALEEDGRYVINVPDEWQ